MESLPARQDRVYRIAVVEDEACVREAVGSLLRSVGYVTAEFASAEAFLAREDHDGIVCLILDVHLPGMNGLELQARIAHLSAPIPIIFISSDGSPGTRHRAMAAGAIAFLNKPFADEDLLAGVRVTIAGLR